MVKKISKFIAYTLFFVLALMLFTPKSSAYFLMEKSLEKFGVVISNETLQESLFSLKVDNLDISIKGIDSANIKEVNIMILILFNDIEFKNIELSSLVNAFVPAKIDNVKISYTLFNPLVVNISGSGRFGELKAKVNLLHRGLKAFLKPSQKMLRSYQNSLRNFKKDKSGEYVYVKNF